MATPYQTRTRVPGSQPTATQTEVHYVRKGIGFGTLLLMLIVLLPGAAFAGLFFRAEILEFFPQLKSPEEKAMNLTPEERAALLAGGEAAEAASATTQEAQRLLRESADVATPSIAARLLGEMDAFIEEHEAWAEPMAGAREHLVQSTDEARRSLVEDVRAALASDDLAQVQTARRELTMFMGAAPVHQTDLAPLLADLNTKAADLTALARENARAEEVIAYAREANRSTDLVEVAGALAVCRRLQGELPRWADRVDPLVDALQRRLRDLQGSMAEDAHVDQLEQQGRLALESEDLGEVIATRRMIEDFITTADGSRYRSRFDPLIGRLRHKEEDLRAQQQEARVDELRLAVEELFTRNPADRAPYEALLEQITGFQREVPSLSYRLRNEVARLEEKIQQIREGESVDEAAIALHQEVLRALESNSVRTVQATRQRVERFQEEHQAHANEFTQDVRQLNAHEALLNRRSVWQSETEALIETAQQAARGSDINAMQVVLTRIREYRDELPDNDEVALQCRLQLEETRENLETAIARRSQVRVAIDSPSPNATFEGRICQVVGRVFSQAVTRVSISVNERVLETTIRNQRFDVEVVLIGGANVIRVEADTEPYEGEAEVTVRCTAPPTQLWAQLVWDDPTADLDLYVTEPSEETVYWDNHRGIGRLDRDERGIGDDGKFGPEHYYLSSAEGHDLVRGDYIFRVHYYSGRGSVRYRLLIFVDDQQYQVRTGTLTRAQPTASLIENFRESSPSWSEVTTIHMPVR